MDAGFVWTEPHSKRLKVKLTVQAEVMNGAILQQTFVVDFVVEWNMCIDCNRANTNVNAWKAAVQVREPSRSDLPQRSVQLSAGSARRWRCVAGPAARGSQTHVHVP